MEKERKYQGEYITVRVDFKPAYCKVSFVDRKPGIVPKRTLIVTVISFVQISTEDNIDLLCFLSEMFHPLRLKAHVPFLICLIIRRDNSLQTAQRTFHVFFLLSVRSSSLRVWYLLLVNGALHKISRL